MGDPFTRRDVLASIGAGGILTMRVPVSASQTPGTSQQAPLSGIETPDDWPMFQLDAGNTGSPSGTTGPAEDIGVAWCAYVDGREGHHPAVAGDRVYYVGGGNTNAVDVESGERRWWREGPSSPFSPAVADGRVFVPHWNGEVVAYDAETGETHWTFQMDELSSVPPAVADGRVYVASNDGTLYALSWERGEQVWQFDTGERLQIPATVVDGTVFTAKPGHGKRLYALDAESGETRWETEPSGQVTAAPAVHHGAVYVAVSSEFQAFDADTGETLWTSRPRRSIRGDPTVSGGTVYYGSDQGTVGALDAVDGTVKWTIHVEDAVRGSPAVADGMVFFGVRDGTIQAVDAETGATRWQFRTGGKVSSSPAVLDGAVFVGSHDGYLYALAPADEVDPPSSGCVSPGGRGTRKTASGDDETASPETAVTSPGTAAGTGTSFLDSIADGPSGMLLWLLGIPIVGPVVLGGLLAALRLTERDRDDDEAS